MVNKGNADSQRDELLQIAEARLHPSLTNPNFLVLRSRRLNFGRWINQIPGQRLNVLDVGGRYQPYRPLFQDRVATYLGLDILQTELVDVVASGESLPFRANTFDAVIATQVFDYFSQPLLAAEQIHWVLKPGGCLLMSVPSFAPRFADGEMWRFTSTGIRLLLSSFRKVEIVAEIYSPGGIIRSINLGLLSIANFRLLGRILELSVVPILNLFAMSFEKCGFTTNDQFTPNYSVLAVK